MTDDQVAFLSRILRAEHRQRPTAYAQGSGEYGIVPLSTVMRSWLVGERSCPYDVSDNAKAGTVGGLGAAVVPVSGRYDNKSMQSHLWLRVPQWLILSSWIWDIVTLIISPGTTTDTYKIAGTDINPSVRARIISACGPCPNVTDLFQPVWWAICHGR